MQIRALWQHMKGLWPRWTLLPAAPFVLWSLYCLIVRGELRWELLIVTFLVPLICYWSERTKRLYLGLLPFGLVGLLYDGMRFVKNAGVSAASVHNCDLRATELRVFGVTVDGARLTLQDYFHQHWSTVADIFFAIPYGTFLFVPLGYAVYLYFKDQKALARYGWTFLLLNVVGFVTYHVYPSAPPWYFHSHGCNVDVAAHAYTGDALARVDRLIGYPYFAGLYGRSNDVFGAVPSLHVAYPLLMVMESWRLNRTLGRSVTVLFWLSTCVAAVYLDHHWVIDVVLGLALTVGLYAPIRLWSDRPLRDPALRPSPMPDGAPGAAGVAASSERA